MATPEVTLRRSLMAVPGNEKNLILDAKSSGADEVFLDLEDSLASDEKVPARAQLIEALQATAWDGITVNYRINGLETKWWLDDVVEIIGSVGEQVDNVVIPKVRDRKEIITVSNILQYLEINNSLSPGSIGIGVHIETAEGMDNVTDIVNSSDRISALVFGPGDYITSIGGQYLVSDVDIPEYYWYYPLSNIANAAASTDVAAIDGAYTDLDDIDGFRRSCEMSRMLGYDGKITIDEEQVEVANEIFAPSTEETGYAERIVSSYEEAESPSTAEIDGMLISEDMYQLAREITAKAEAVNQQ